MILKMISSLAWSAGTVLNGSEFSERADELSELFIVVSGKEGMWSSIVTHVAGTHWMSLLS